MDEEYKVPVYMLTTIDNPFHPLNEYDQWLSFDEDHGYRTYEYLDRVYGISMYAEDSENQIQLNAVIDDAVRLAPFLYKKVLIEE